MTFIGVILSVLAAGLAIMLARETKLRRALQSLCNRLLARLADAQHRHVGSPPSTHHRHRRS
jgi:uncharacterized membrane protein YccC